MKLTMCIVLIVSFTSVAQEKFQNVLPVKSSKVTYSEVIEIKEQSKDMLNDKIRIWLELQDIELLTEKSLDEKHDSFKCKSSMKLLWGPNDFKELYKEIQFDINFITKNERYQYEITDFIIKDPGKEIQLEIFKLNKSKHKPYNRDFYKKIDLHINIIIESIVHHMSAQ